VKTGTGTAEEVNFAFYFRKDNLLFLPLTPQWYITAGIHKFKFSFQGRAKFAMGKFAHWQLAAGLLLSFL